jgi:dinuclear metal center YbgI/SA1388 family protein
MPTISELCTAIERLAPPPLAASWDNVGLLLGDPSAAADRVLTCLTLTPDVADEAVADGFHLIVTHHPILFRGAKRLTADTPEGRVVLELARAGVAVYSPHTAFDDAPGGINDQLATILGLTAVRPIRPSPRDECKIVVFVPGADLARVSDAMFAAGAGEIGEYRECSFRLAGTGTFFGTDASNPAVGLKGRREEVAEWRLEVVCPARRVAAVVAAMRSVHSYEEPAYDVYPLTGPANRGGSGRIGQLPAPTPARDLARRLTESLRCPGVHVGGDPERPVSRVAVACGAAGEFLDDAGRAGADAFVTGEMRFHDALAARAAGVTTLLVGHYASERFALETLARRLAEIPGVRAAAASQKETDPLTWVGREI